MAYGLQHYVQMNMDFLTSGGDKMAHWLVNMGLQETAWVVLYKRTAWRLFMLQNFEWLK